MLHCAPTSFVIDAAFAKIVCEPGWKWQKREKPMANFDLFYVWSGEGEVLLNGKPYPSRQGKLFPVPARRLSPARRITLKSRSC